METSHTFIPPSLIHQVFIHGFSLPGLTRAAGGEEVWPNGGVRDLDSDDRVTQSGACEGKVEDSGVHEALQAGGVLG